MLCRGFIALVALAVVGGCGASPTGAASLGSGVVAPSNAAPNDAAHNGAAGSAPLVFGATSTDVNGLAVTVGAPRVVPLPAGARPVRSWPTYVTFAITVINGTAKIYDPQSLFVSLTSGKDIAEQIFAADAGLSGAPTEGVVAGTRTSFVVAYGVGASAALTLEIAPDFTQPTVVYQS